MKEIVKTPVVLGLSNLIYLDSPSLNKQLNVSLHFQKLSSIMEGNCTQSKIQNLASLKTQLKNNCSEVVYFLAHSDKRKGMYIGENSNVNGEKLAALFSNQQQRIPKIVIFNTCYGVQSGLVEACLGVGVETVVASEGAITIKFMDRYMERIFEELKDRRRTLPTAVERVNKEFEEIWGEFIVFKNEDYGKGID
ncbi:MAG: hypothetical protein GQ564_21665 [Bacteroidales bacterium]|nr:hypothetical protein [Bacteroidales bacterium]